MRVAICFYGLIGGKSKKFGEGEQLDPIEAYNFYKKNVFSQLSNYDIFIHSQSYEAKEKLLEIYKPKSYIIEKRKNFILNAITNFSLIKYVFFFPFRYILSFLKKKKYDLDIKKNFLRCKNSYSRWYSTKKTIELMNEHQKLNQFEYDLVFLTRLDVAFLTPFKFDEINKEKMTVSHHNDIAAPRNDYKAEIKKNNRTHEKGLSDLWFLTNPKKMLEFSMLYNHLNKYLISPHMSSYQHVNFLNLELNFYKFRSLDFEPIRRLNKSEE